MVDGDADVVARATQKENDSEPQQVTSRDVLAHLRALSHPPPHRERPWGRNLCLALAIRALEAEKVVHERVGEGGDFG